MVKNLPDLDPITEVADDDLLLARDVSEAEDRKVTVETLLKPASPELELFCAISDITANPYAFTSPDGVKWTRQTLALGDGWRSICWSPELGRFCAVSSSSSDYIATITI